MLTTCTALRTHSLLAGAWLEKIAPALTDAVALPDDHLIAAAVGDALLADLPDAADLLTRRQLQGSPEHYQQNVLATALDGSFSVAALVWRPGQHTSVHDHLCWCVVTVLKGQEHEARYEFDEDSTDVGSLRPTAQLWNRPGSVSAVVPPGDIHRVSNVSDDVVVSLHVYGADIAASATSIRRVYLA